MFDLGLSEGDDHLHIRIASTTDFALKICRPKGILQLIKEVAIFEVLVQNLMKLLFRVGFLMIDKLRTDTNICRATVYIKCKYFARCHD